MLTQTARDSSSIRGGTQAPQGIVIWTTRRYKILRSQSPFSSAQRETVPFSSPGAGQPSSRAMGRCWSTRDCSAETIGRPRPTRASPTRPRMTSRSAPMPRCSAVCQRCARSTSAQLARAARRCHGNRGRGEAAAAGRQRRKRSPDGRALLRLMDTNRSANRASHLGHGRTSRRKKSIF